MFTLPCILGINPTELEFGKKNEIVVKQSGSGLFSVGLIFITISVSILVIV